MVRERGVSGHARMVNAVRAVSAVSRSVVGRHTHSRVTPSRAPSRYTVVLIV